MSAAGDALRAKGTAKARYPLSFTEEMKGFFTFGEADSLRGFDRGRAARTGLKFHLTIAIVDTDALVADPAQASPATGYVESDPLGGRCPVEVGEFNLFVDAGEVNGRPGRQMRYRLWFRDAVGHPLTLSGFKELSHPASPFVSPAELWRKTTTLYIHLSSGFVAGQEGAGVVGAGVLHVLPSDFARQLATFRVGGPGLGGRAEALGAFGRLFVEGLWDVFGPRRAVAAG